MLFAAFIRNEKRIDIFARVCYNEKTMKKYKYILLDLDGTLVHSHYGIFACFRYAMEKMGKPNPTDEELYPVVGPSLFYSFTQFFGMDEREARRAVALYRERYATRGVWENQPIEGVLPALKKMHAAGYRLALATSKPIEYASKIVKKHGFSVYLTEEVGSGIDGSLPTKTEVIAECIRRLGGEKEEYLMVGDRNYDAIGATETGIDCALLKIGGYATEEELYSCGAKYVLKDFTDLLRLLNI